MAVITGLIIKQINDILTKTSTQLSSAGTQNTEAKYAQEYLTGLIQPYLENPQSLTDDAAGTLTAQLMRFFRLRALHVPNSKDMPVDVIYAKLSENKILSCDTPTLEEKTSVAMLNSILKKEKIKYVALEENILHEFPEQLDKNYYMLMSDPTKTIENLYNFTVKNPIHEYLPGHPLVLVAIEFRCNTLLDKMMAEHSKHILDVKKSESLESVLHYAVRHRNEKAIELILQAGADINEISIETKLTALMLACKQELPHAESIKILLAHKKVQRDDGVVRGIMNSLNISSPSNNDSDFDTALAALLKAKDATNVKSALEILLLQSTVFVTACQNDSHFYAWANNYSYQVYEIASECRKTIQISSSGPLKSKPTKSSFRQAVEKKLWADVFAMLGDIDDVGDVINQRYSDDKHLLHIAAASNQLLLVTALLKKGVDVNVVDKNKNTPMHDIACTGYVRIGEILISYNANINCINDIKNTPLSIAACREYDNMVQFLVDNGADITLNTRFGRTALQWAQGCEKSRNVAILRAIESKLKYLVIKNNWAEIINRLNGSSPAIDERYDNDQDLLHVAVVKNQPLIASKLLSLGKNCDVTDSINQTPLHYAAMNGNLEIAKMLIDNNANIDCVDKDGNTPLMLAAYRRSYPMVKWLLECNADINIKSNQNKTAMDWAEEGKQPMNIKYLKTYQKNNLNDRDNDSLREELETLKRQNAVLQNDVLRLKIEMEILKKSTSSKNTSPVIFTRRKSLGDLSLNTHNVGNIKNN